MTATGRPPTAARPPAPVTPARVVGAFCAAVALQIGSLIMSFAAFLIWLLALTDGLFDPRTEMAWWGWAAVPLLQISVALWIASGAAAARIARRRAGWLTLLLLPVTPSLVSALAGLV